MMKISFDVVMKSGNQDVDMDYAIDTLAGTAQVTCLIAEGILNQKVIKRRTSSNEVRAVLKQSFKSSYGQNFDVILNNQEHIKTMGRITRTTFSEVMRYFITEALYIESQQISPKAEAIIASLSDIEDDLIERIRNPLEEMHKITIESGYNVELNYKRPTNEFKIITLTQDTARNITQSVIEKEIVDIVAAITRYNSRTGNGRLLIPGEDKTIAFGFFEKMIHVSPAQKKKISANLHTNVALAQEDYVPLNIKVREVKVYSGETVKYLIMKVED
ncbi:hypothetical protein ABEG91_15350 [Pantoea agglomerans]|uniref:hypothetical protein n=1 Tax=Enterobacter agglomerans TaxID=549 RepID=UPI00320866BF